MNTIDSFARSLRAQIDVALSASDSNHRANRWFWTKGFILALAAVGSWVFLVTSHGFWLFFAAPVHLACVAMLVFNVGHDGAHRSASRSQAINSLLATTFFLVGITPSSWHLKHNVAHHSFPNVQGLDPDLDFEPMLRLAPNQKHRPWHRYQGLYAPILYALSGIIVAVVADVGWFWGRRFRGETSSRLSLKEIVTFVLGKIFYLVLEWALPILIASNRGQMLLALVTAQLVLGLVFAAVLLPSHVNGFVTMYSPEESRGRRAVAQLETTLDFAVDSRLAHAIFGGFNANVLHHLFPDICHVHLRKLTPMLAVAARQAGLKYYSTTLLGALVSHWGHLKRLSLQP